MIKRYITIVSKSDREVLCSIDTAEGGETLVNDKVELIISNHPEVFHHGDDGVLRFVCSDT